MSTPRPGSEPPASLAKRPVIALVTSHWLAMLGLGIVLTAIVLWLTLASVQLRSGEENPYIGVALTLVGVILLVGLAVTPIGLYLGRRRLQQRLATDGGVAWKRLLAFVVVVSLINLVIASRTTEEVVHRMESRQFCGSCHVMTPETRAFSEGPHAGLLCVDCHVGNGTAGFIEAKIGGTRQLLSVMTDSVEMPIHTAIESGRIVGSDETCEGCHWKQRPAQAKIKMIRRYGEDEANTPETTLLTMNVGGTLMGGIHGAHNREGVEIRFVAADKKRQDIQLVEYVDTKAGTTRTYVKDGVDAASLADAPRIRMQCFDCHNRPAHVFLLPERAVDQALLLGRMSQSLPFLKKTSVEILRAGYPSSAAAAEEIPKRLAAYYREKHPEVSSDRAAEVEEAGLVLADIYSRNVFPELEVDWGTYPNNLGHETAPGCYRCHGGEHTNEAGETLTQDCFHCHFPAAVEEEDPEIIKLLGIDRLMKPMQKK